MFKRIAADWYVYVIANQSNLFQVLAVTCILGLDLAQLEFTHREITVSCVSQVLLF